MSSTFQHEDDDGHDTAGGSRLTESAEFYPTRKSSETRAS